MSQVQAQEAVLESVEPVASDAPHVYVVGSGDGLAILGYPRRVTFRRVNGGKAEVSFHADPSSITTDAKVAAARKSLGALATPDALFDAAWQGSVRLTGADAESVLSHLGIALDALPSAVESDPRWSRFASAVTAGTLDGRGVRIAFPRTAADTITTADPTIRARMVAMMS